MALTDNLVSYWKLDGNSNDSVSTNNGTDTSISYTTGNGKINLGAGAITTSQIDLGTPAAFAYSTSSVFSISFWIKTTVTAFVLLGRIQSVFPFAGWSFGVGAGTKWEFIMNASSNTTSYDTDATPALDGNFHFITFTYDGTNSSGGGKIYIDGVSKSLTTANSASGSPSYASDMFLIHAQGDGFIGSLDEVGIWSKVLSSAEVTQLYNGGKGLTYLGGNFISAGNSHLTLLGVS